MKRTDGGSCKVRAMDTPAQDAKNWFDQGGEAYARFRPRYPDALAEALATLAPNTRVAVDVGCGTGQLTTLLAAHFAHVLGVDASDDQIANAEPHARVAYACAPATALPVSDRSADLVTVAQAAHWFDLPAFYAEVRRIAAPQAAVALVAYGVPHLPHGLDERFQRFYAEEIGPYWPAERRLVDRGYVDLAFPFDEAFVPPQELRVAWSLESFLGYIATWSAVRRAREAGREDVLVTFARDLAEAWGSPGTPRTVAWPLHVRAGRVGG